MNKIKNFVKYMDDKHENSLLIIILSFSVIFSSILGSLSFLLLIKYGTLALLSFILFVWFTFLGFYIYKYWKEQQ